MPGEYVDVKKFKKVVLLYNRNSGKQLFASMMAKVNETYNVMEGNRRETKSPYKILKLIF